MVFFNYATMQMAAKIVYYGPGLCGKTTNLHQVYDRTSPQSRGEMVSLETETDRTLFFDLLPLDVGVIGGFRTRLQLYTVPGQVFYNTTRKLVLKGADGIVFVADSQEAMLDANTQSLKNLRLNLEELGLDLEEMPLVIQLNKRDLPNALPPEEILKALDPEGKWQHVEAVAVEGTGVFETLKLISKLTLKSLREKMTGVESETAEAASSSRFKIHGGKSSPAKTGESGEAEPFPPPEPPSIDPGRTISAPLPEEAAAAAVATETLTDEETPAKRDEESDREEEPDKEPARRVRMRSSVDVMAELEMLRKKATSGLGTVKVPESPGKKDRKVAREDLGLGVSAAAREMTVTVVVSDEEGEPLETLEKNIKIDPGRTKKLLMTLGIDVEAE